MKILLLSAWYPNRILPENGNFIKKHAKAISKFCNVNVLFVCPDSNISKYEIYNFQEDNYTETIIYYTTVKFRNKFISKILKITKFIFFIAKGIKIIFKKYGKPDITHVNVLTRNGIVGYYLKTFYKIPYIITEHWTGYLHKNDLYKGFLKRKLSEFVVRKAKTVTAVSGNLKKAMISHKLNNKDFQIVYNIIDTEIFKPLPYPEPKIFKQIIHISNFKDEHKNITGILRTIKKVSKKRTDFKLIIVGSSPEIEKYKQYAGELGIYGNFVSFAGRKNQEELAVILAESSFLLMFSNYETFQIPLIESISCGIPVITTKCGTILDDTGNKFGKIIEPGNETQLFEAINFMLDNHNNFDKTELRNYALDNFGTDRIAMQFLDIYKK